MPDAAIAPDDTPTTPPRATPDTARPPSAAEASATTRESLTSAQLQDDTGLVELLRAAIDAAAGDDGFAPLARVGSIVTNRRTDFDPRTYGHPKLGGLVRAIGLFHIDTRHPGEGKPPVLYIRDPMATPSSAGPLPKPTHLTRPSQRPR